MLNLLVVGVIIWLNLSPYQAAPQDAVVLNVPAYIWHHGCGPTAAGMILGYYDDIGIETMPTDDPFTQDQRVNSVIASPGNYADYALPTDYVPGSFDTSTPVKPDKSSDPQASVHPDDSLADYAHTSRSSDGQHYGWSDPTAVVAATRRWLEEHGHRVEVVQYTVGGPINNPHYFWFANLKQEIDAGRPVLVLVAGQDNGYPNHIAVAVGYGTIEGKPYYAAYNTWDRDLHWYEFNVGSQHPQLFTIWGAWSFKIMRTVYLPMVSR